MRPTPPILYCVAANLWQTRWALQRRIGLQKCPRAPQGEVGEWTQIGTGTAVAHIFVFAYRCPTTSARMSHPDPLADRSGCSEYRSSNSEAHCSSGRRHIETYVVT